MKILFLGEIGIGQTSLMRMRAFARMGHEVRGVNTIKPWSQTSWLQRRLQRKLQRGPVVDEINRSVLQAARDFGPDIIWGEKQEYLRADTIRTLREKGARVVHFTPDPYFSLSWKRTRLMDAAMGEFDVLVYCKRYEQGDYKALGKPLVYMPLGFCDEVHRPLASSDPRWHCAVGFLGGWEPRRERLLHAVAASGADLKVWGGYWDFLRDGKWTPRRHVILRQLAGNDRDWRIHRNDVLARAWQGNEVYDDDYARALSGSRIGLGFLRKVVPDQHTTRTFEIPACGSMLLADRTDEHRDFFEEGREAEFFASTEELLDKLDYYTAHEETRRTMAEAGRRRCIDGGYDYLSRLRGVLAQLERVG
jgi:spore maturation protein CgeB